ncbi:MAG: histidine triad nucleotide-binding protein [Candidatus Peregrinibacteria bacterium]|nr:histidine triad nucleotide-binding protein [Candidatus Peregrinibacteria bacterium]MDZ4245029.1 histidine triad nucleotide-binding protein [Candidatus Gracilibacteria bacterium]
MSDCIFCKIDAGEIPSTKLFEDKKCFIIKDINPKAPLHFLVIPHQHIPTISDLHEGEEMLAGHMIKLGKEIALKEGAQGYKLLFNVHEKGGQEVFHIHLHVLGWN